MKAINNMKIVQQTRHLLPILALAASLQTTLGYYDPAAQRWINRDPIGEAGFAVGHVGRSAAVGRGASYTFCDGAPTRWFDAYGLESNDGQTIQVIDLQSCFLAAWQRYQATVNSALGRAAKSHFNLTCVAGAATAGSVIGTCIKRTRKFCMFLDGVVGVGDAFLVGHLFDEMKKIKAEAQQTLEDDCAYCATAWFPFEHISASEAMDEARRFLQEHGIKPTGK